MQARLGNRFAHRLAETTRARCTAFVTTATRTRVRRLAEATGARRTAFEMRQVFRSPAFVVLIALGLVNVLVFRMAMRRSDEAAPSFTLRLCALGYRTTAEDVEALVREVVEAARDGGR